MTPDHARALTIRDIGGCTCWANGIDFHTGTTSPLCKYHAAAEAQPWNHHIPWNCPTYWDGCNCEGGPYYEPPKEPRP